MARTSLLNSRMCVNKAQSKKKSRTSGKFGTMHGAGQESMTSKERIVFCETNV